MKVQRANSTLSADTEKKLKRTPLRRRTELGAGDTTSGRPSRPNRRRAVRAISPASRAQRQFVKAYGRCLNCGAENSEYVRLTFAHFWPRGRGGCDSDLCGHVLCVRPGGMGCHGLQERGEVDLLKLIVADPFWDAQGRERFQHALEHSLPVELMEKLTGARIEWSSP